MGLFDSMFKELDAIITTVSHTAAQFEDDVDPEIKKNVVTPADANSQLDNLNKSLDNFSEKQRNFMKKFNKKEVKDDDK